MENKCREWHPIGISNDPKFHLWLSFSIFPDSRGSSDITKLIWEIFCEVDDVPWKNCKYQLRKSYLKTFICLLNHCFWRSNLRFFLWSSKSHTAWDSLKLNIYSCFFHLQSFVQVFIIFQCYRMEDINKETKSLLQETQQSVPGFHLGESTTSI